MKHIHFIGIGGTGLSAIARVLLEKGYVVSGSDRTASPLFKAITSAGARTFLGHSAEHIAGADLIIRSSAVPDDNPEVLAALEHGIPVLKRADFLEELTADKDTIAVAGSHGKTTTTAMLIWILDQIGAQPSFISGGIINKLSCNARAGSGPYFVIEADEYDYMFLGLSPKIAIVTNIEHDHPDCFPTAENYRDAFKNFLHRIRPDGLALMCFDDLVSQNLIKEMKESNINFLGYGTTAESNYRIHNFRIVDGLPQFDLTFQQNGSEENFGTVKLSVPGHHNVLNATAALGAVHQLGLPVSKAVEALSTFLGAGRRFEIVGNIEDILIVDDYGHHPTQIAATLQAARTHYPNHQIWAAWQPHTYSRTQMLEKEYIQALNLADKVIVLKVYAAREDDPGYSAEKIAEALPGDKAQYIPGFEDASRVLLDTLTSGDILILFSAGDATKISSEVLKGLRERHPKEQDRS
jgi:UDP-N-acetylmuramate--alanine ligase